MKTMTRHEARCEAFALIFQINQHREEMDELIKDREIEKPECAGQFIYIKNTVKGVLEKEKELKEIIARNLTGSWSMDRITKIAMTALKLAVYEIKYVDDVPPKVAINEAVNLSKEFADDETGAFVNGVLSGVFKELCE